MEINNGNFRVCLINGKELLNSTEITTTPDNNNYNEPRFWSVMSGKRWLDGAVSYCGFVPILPPNAPSCSSKVSNATVTPSSFHSGGVNTGMADGGCKFISETINYTTNFANGGEGDAWQNRAPINGPTVHGVWGALGSASSNENTGL